MKSYGTSSTYYNGSLTWTNLKAQIDKQSPIYVSWGWSSGGGHAVVSYGYTTASNINYVYYMDPWTGGKTALSYTSFKGGSNYDRSWRSGLKDF